MIYNHELTVKQKLGNIIKEIRKQNQISQENFAVELIYNQSVISRMEKGYDQIPLEVYHRSLNLFNLTYETNMELEVQIGHLISQIYQSYEHLKIVDFNNYLKQVNDYLKVNKDIILHYDLLIMKLTCVYMLSRYDEANELIHELKHFYHICHHKCQILYHVLKTQLFLLSKKSNQLNQSQIPLRQDSDHGLIQYMWTKYYLSTFNYPKAITILKDAIASFKKDNIKQRIMRCELIINELSLKDHQYEFVKYRTLNLLEDIEEIHPFDINKLYFHLAYSYYHLGEYQSCIDTFTKINKEQFHEHNFIIHMTNKALFHLNLKFPLDFTKVNSYNVLDYLYFNYIDNQIDDNYYLLIERYLVDEFEFNYFKKEYQIYLLNLLDYYYKFKKYKKYKGLSDKIHKVLHI